MGIGSRVRIPLVVTLLVLPVMVWDVSLSHARMLYDIGPPLWPYQVPSILLWLFDAPAVVLARPFVSLLHAYEDWSRDLCLLLATPIIWWWIADRVNNGFLRPPYRFPRTMGISFLLMAISFGVPLVAGFDKHFGLWPEEPWFLACAVLFAVSGMRLLRQNDLPAVHTAKWDHRMTETGLALWLAAFALTPAAEALRHYNHADSARGDSDPDACVYARDSGCIHGRVQTVAGAPIEGLSVEAVPLTSPANTHPMLKLSTTADRRGRYSFDVLEPGTYLVGVYVHLPPSSDLPYAKRFYPGIELEQAAARLEIKANQSLLLRPLRVPRVPVSEFAVEIRWPNGSHPVRSHVWVRNLDYPGEWVLTPAPQIDDGFGKLTVPQQANYSLVASVECDGDAYSKQESAEGPLHVSDHAEPARLVLTLQGAPCRVR